MNIFKAASVFGICFLLPIPFVGTQIRSYPIVSEAKDGSKTLTSPRYPRDGYYVAKLIEEVVIGESSNKAEATLGKVWGIDIDQMGNVFVMDRVDVSIKKYNERGDYINMIGRPGQGPGEFGGVGVLFSVMSTGRLCILDFFQRRLMIMTAKGEYVSGFKIEGEYNGLAVDATDRIFLARRESKTDLGQLTTALREVSFLTELFRIDYPAKRATQITAIKGETWVMSASADGRAGASGGRFVVVWNISRDGRLYVGFNGDYRIRVFSRMGKEEFVFGREFTALKDPSYEGKMGQRRTLPVFRSIVMDDDDNLWLELYQERAARGFLYDVFSPEGTFCKQVAVEQKIGRLKNRKMYSVVLSAEGYPTIRRYGIELLPMGN